MWFHLLATLKYPRSRQALRRGSVLPLAAVIYVASVGLFLSSNNAGNPPASDTANVWVSPAGNDGTCARSATPETLAASLPCLTFNQAYIVANAGDKALANTGTYTPPSGSSGIYDTSGKVLTFGCTTGAAADSVTFSDPVFYFWPGVSNVTFQGACYWMHIPYIGLGGYGTLTHDITLDGVHMDGFNIAGAQNITLKNGNVGPSNACYGNTVPVQNQCNPASSDPTERYWATQGGYGSVQQEPYIHSGAAGDSSVVIDHERIHGISTKLDTVHTGGLLVWTVASLTISNSQFDHNAIYNLEPNAGSNFVNVDIENTIYGASYYTNDPAEGANQGQQLPDSQCQDGGGASTYGITYTNDLFRYNTYVQCGGLAAGSTDPFTNVRFVGNLIGNNGPCAATSGVTYTDNVVGNGYSSCNGGPVVTGSPFVSESGNNYHPDPTKCANISNVVTYSGDAALNHDINGVTRPSHTKATAGAYEPC